MVVTIGERFESASPDGYPVYRYPWRYTGMSIDKAIRWLIFPFYFRRILKHENPDIVHSHSVSILSFMAGFIAKRRGIPAIIKFAGDWVWETLSTHAVRAKDFDDLRRRSLMARLLWRVEKRGLALFDWIWAPSEFRAQNVEHVQGHRRNVKVIYNALDLPDGGHHEMKESGPFIMVAANRFVPHKRLAELVSAFAQLKNPNARLILIGAGQNAEIEKVKQAAAEAGVRDQVMLTGRIETEELYIHFKKSSIYVSNSLEEGFPNVFVEAMHFGLPIISADVGGCHEIVRDRQTGFLFDSENQNELIAKMKSLMNDIELRNKMAKSAYEYSRQYELSAVLQQFLDLYKTAFAQKKIN